MQRLMLVLVCVACGKNTEPPPPSTGSPMAQPESGPRAKQSAAIPERSQQMYVAICALCHGADGSGNGPTSETLNPKPRNYTDMAWQASVTDDDIRNIILLGGQAVGKSPLMPAQVQLKDQPDVLDGLVRIIRGFGKR